MIRETDRQVPVAAIYCGYLCLWDLRAGMNDPQNETVSLLQKKGCGFNAKYQIHKGDRLKQEGNLAKNNAAKLLSLKPC